MLAGRQTHAIRDDADAVTQGAQLRQIQLLHDVVACVNPLNPRTVLITYACPRGEPNAALVGQLSHIALLLREVCERIRRGRLNRHTRRTVSQPRAHVRGFGGLAGRCHRLVGIGAILGEIVHEEVDAHPAECEEDGSAHSHRGPDVFTALLVDLGVLRTRRIAVIERKNGRVVFERLAPDLLKLAR